MDIFVKVDGQKLSRVSDVQNIVAGTKEFILFNFLLPSEWSNLTIFAQFIQNGKSYNKYLDPNNRVCLPTEIKEGSFTLALKGTHESVVAVTDFITFNTSANPIRDEESSTVITPTLYEQLVNKVNANESAINAINNETTGILAKAKEYADGKSVIDVRAEGNFLVFTLSGKEYRVELYNTQEETSGSGRAGFGIGNSFSNPEGGVKSNYGTIDDSFINEIAKAGFKFVRIIVDFGKNNWSAGVSNKENYPDGYTGGAMDFVIKQSWIDTLSSLADLCKTHGMELTICPFGWMVFWAQVQGNAPGYSSWGEYYWASPNKYTKNYCVAYLARLWTQLANGLKAKSNVNFEIVNEPLNHAKDRTNGLYTWRSWTGESYDSASSYNSDDWDGCDQSNNWAISSEAASALSEMELGAINAIRSTGATNKILCPTYAQNTHYGWIKYIHENVIMQSGDNNAEVAIHWYMPNSICGSNVQTGATFDPNDSSYVGSSTSYIKGLTAIQNALNDGIKMIITEGSVCMSKTRVSDAERLAWATDIRENIIEKGIQFSIFDNGCLLNGNDFGKNSGEDYGIFDRILKTWSDTAMVNMFAKGASS